MTDNEKLDLLIADAMFNGVRGYDHFMQVSRFGATRTETHDWIWVDSDERDFEGSGASAYEAAVNAYNKFVNRPTMRHGVGETK